MTYIINRRQITETVAAPVLPVSLAEMKVHVREDYNDNDTILYNFIQAATTFIEKEYQFSLVQRTYRADVEGFSYRYRLPMPPLASITSIKYYTPDSPQVLTTLDSNFYRADLGRGEIYIDADAGNIPNIASRHDAVQITYVSGYAPDFSPQDYTANIPEAIKAAIKLQAADLFENRETHTQLKMQQLDTTKMLLAPWREL